MAELGGGFYVSRVDTEDYEPDDEDGGLVHVLFEDDETAAGLWKPNPDPAATYEGLVLPGRETIVILKGSVRIEVEDGPTLELGVGDMASMPKGAVTTWHASPDFEKVWIYS